MRLGAYKCKLLTGTNSFNAYKKEEINERHRHRLEFNNKFKDDFIKAGMQIAGINPDRNLVEIIELKPHRWFVGCQFHPEFKSKPVAPHPLFSDFISAALRYNKDVRSNIDYNEDIS